MTTLKIAAVITMALFSGLLAAQPSQAPGPGGGPQWRGSNANTPGWSLMTEQERLAHRDRMRSLTSYDECAAYVAEHHALMVERATAAGKTLPAPRSACARFSGGAGRP